MQNVHASAQVIGLWSGPAALPSSDHDLLKSIAAGNRLAMRTLFARHNVRTYRFVLRLMDDPGRAEDIVSEVFFDIWRQADRFRGHCRVSTWILAIARYKAISALRHRRYEALEDEAAEQIADTADDPEIALERKNDYALLRTCLGQLSTKHREIIDLVYYQERSVQEAADILGVPPNTVKTRMFYARKQLLELIEQAGGRRA